MTRGMAHLSTAIFVLVLLCTPTSHCSTAGQFTPPDQIDLGAIAARLNHQASYRVAINIEQGDIAMAGNLTVIRAPASVYLLQTQPVMHYVEIGGRSWFGVGTETEPQWIANNDDRLADLRDHGKEAAQGFVKAAFGVLGFTFNANQQAMLSQTDQTIEGMLCHVYTWTAGEADGNVCVTSDHGLPVHAMMSGSDFAYTMTFSHYNDSANVLQPPFTEAPDTLYVADAWMALHGLSSFQWTFTETGVKAGESAAESVILVYQGTYRQVDLVWQTGIWINGQTDHPPEIRGLEQRGLRWVALGSEDWIQVPPFTDDTDVQFERSDPFAFWYDIDDLVIGSMPLIERSARQVDGITCDMYGIEARISSAQGLDGMSSSRICVAPDSGLPLYAEQRAERAGDSISYTWELHATDDAQNVIEVPEVLWETPYYEVETAASIGPVSPQEDVSEALMEAELAAQEQSEPSASPQVNAGRTPTATQILTQTPIPTSTPTPLPTLSPTPTSPPACIATFHINTYAFLTIEDGLNLIRTGSSRGITIPWRETAEVIGRVDLWGFGCSSVTTRDGCFYLVEYEGHQWWLLPPLLLAQYGATGTPVDLFALPSVEDYLDAFAQQTGPMPGDYSISCPDGVSVPSITTEGAPAPTAQPRTPQPTVTPTPWCEGIIRSTQNVNVRSGPGLNADVVTVLNPGTTVSIRAIDAERNWMRIREGWVYAPLVEVDTVCLTQLPTER